ncbi:glutathione hydrolase 1 proenzyme-like isoform X2 [Episyrphus balteatus]|uniref:glutathione hydrolase 1 proenzyme-like isoform X2 n=1 Tax=Episyrphus balteatus TaxID=286459 RepID=UPI002486A0B4|nr:glutathione hydrolase 1 proenzyme-like isoform X2 [Episyrphus balteatus]
MALGDDDDNKMPLKDRTCNDEDTDLNMTAETRLEQRRENILKWMKRLTIALIILIGVFLLGYMFWNLTFSDAKEPKLVVEDVHIASLNDGGVVVPMRDAESVPATTITIPTTLKPDSRDNSIKNIPEVTTKAAEVPSLEEFESKLGVYEKAAVCSDSGICSKVGSDIIKRGGNAVDSVLSVLLCNGIVTMQSMGIGGGFIMNVFIKKDNRAYTIDAREVAPFNAHESMFVKQPSASLSSPEAIAVPGEVMGYYQAHTRFGSLPWKQIIEPAIKICEEGFIMSEHQFGALGLKPSVKNDTLLRSAFVNNATGEFHEMGSKIMPPRELCQTYVNLSKNGPLDFYNGSIAKDIAADLKDLGSIVTADDLEAYSADFVSSISMPLGRDTLYAVPPVGSGSVVAHILSILNGYNLTKDSFSNETTKALFLHRMAEAFKFGFAKRWELSDMRFNDELRDLVSQLTSTDFGEELRKKINDSATSDNNEFYGARFSSKDDFGTSHISVLAPNGDAVSVTSSVNHYFGAGFTGKRTGILFNSGMDDFSTPGVPNQFDLPPAPSNFIEPQKRAMSSMSPMILTNSTGHVKLVIGSAGGSKIITAVAQIIARVVWFGEDIKTAIDAPRIHHQLIPNILSYENESLESIAKLLEAKGHKTVRFLGRGSTMCGIAQNRTAIYANADFRKRGGIDGF